MLTTAVALLTFAWEAWLLMTVVRRPCADSILLARIAVATSGCVVLIVVGNLDHRAVVKAFMRECMQDHKRYECTALWRAGGPQSALVIRSVPRQD